MVSVALQVHTTCTLMSCIWESCKCVFIKRRLLEWKLLWHCFNLKWVALLASAQLLLKSFLRGSDSIKTDGRANVPLRGACACVYVCLHTCIWWCGGVGEGGWAVSNHICNSPYSVTSHRNWPVKESAGFDLLALSLFILDTTALSLLYSRF